MKLHPAAAVLLGLLGIAANLGYNASHDNGGVPLYTYRTGALYNEAFQEEGIFPDLFLRLAVEKKKVVMSAAPLPYSAYSTYGKDEEDGNPFDRNYLIDNDYARYFLCFAGECEFDSDLPRREEVSDAMRDARDRFSDLGIANDMLKHVYMLNEEEVQQASAFWYSWYYQAFAERRSKYVFPHIYVELQSVSAEDSLIAIWDEKENLYLMGSGFFEKELRAS